MKLRGFLFLIPILGFCQELIVSEIIHKGNTLTKDYIIAREIQHHVGEPLDSTIAVEDRNRLINLGIFADVNWRAIPLDNKILNFMAVDSLVALLPVMMKKRAGPLAVVEHLKTSVAEMNS